MNKNNKRDLYELSKNEFDILFKEVFKDGEDIKNQCILYKQQIMEHSLWTDKYKPNKIEEIIGNNNVINILKNWLMQWDDNHLKNKKNNKSNNYFNNNNNNTKLESDIKNKKAVLISGQCGIGKSLSVKVVAKTLGYDIIEFNSGDIRNKEELERRTTLPKFRAITLYTIVKTNPKQILLMDEIDTMGKSDKGGMSALIEFIKISNIPIICICNDRFNQKLKSLTNHCLDLRFQKPPKTIIMKRILEICKKESIAIDERVIDNLVEGLNCDIRSIINNLQTLKNKTNSKSCLKDLDMSIYDLVPKFLVIDKTKKYNLEEYINMFFIDSNLLPLFIQENYIRQNPFPQDKTSNGEELRLNKYHEACDSISLSDNVDKIIKRNQSWQLSPFYGITSSLIPSLVVKSNYTPPFDKFGGPWKFPSFLGNLSHTNKNIRITANLNKSSLNTITGTNVDVVLDYIPIWKNVIINSLVKDQNKAIDQVITFMDTYSLTRDDIDLLQELTSFSLRKKEIQPKIETKVKTAFTKKFNKTHKKLSKIKLNTNNNEEENE
jgi:replication factor C subunit 1